MNEPYCFSIGLNLSDKNPGMLLSEHHEYVEIITQPLSIRPFQYNQEASFVSIVLPDESPKFLRNEMSMIKTTPEQTKQMYQYAKFVLEATGSKSFCNAQTVSKALVIFLEKRNNGQLPSDIVCVNVCSR
jgi:hypothetical protein